MRLLPIRTMRLTSALLLTTLFVSLVSFTSAGIADRLARKLGQKSASHKKPVAYKLQSHLAASKAKPAAQKGAGQHNTVSTKKVYACGKAFQFTPCSGDSSTGRQHCTPCFPGYRNIQFHICQSVTQQAPSCTDALWWMFRQKEGGVEVTKTSLGRQKSKPHPKAALSTKAHASLLSRLSKGYHGYRKPKVSSTQSKHAPSRQKYPAHKAAASHHRGKLTRSEQIAALTKKLQLTNHHFKTRYGGSSSKAATKPKQKKYVFGHASSNKALSSTAANHKTKPASNKYKVYYSRLSHAKNKPKPVINRYKSTRSNQIKRPQTKSIHNKYKLPQHQYKLPQHKYKQPHNTNSRYGNNKAKPKITLGKKLSKPKQPYLFDGKNYYDAFKSRYKTKSRGNRVPAYGQRGNNRYQGNYYGRQQKPPKTAYQLKHDDMLRRKYGLSERLPLRRGFHKNAGPPKPPSKYKNRIMV